MGTGTPPTLRFDNMATHTTTYLARFLREIRADSLDDVQPAVQAAEHAAREGNWVGGFISYDAAPAFDDALTVSSHSKNPLPLAWFGVFAEARVADFELARSSRAQTRPKWSLNTNESDYAQRVEDIQGRIRAGDVYQVNFTTRATTSDPIDPIELYRQLLVAQQPQYGALITHDEFAVVSASPELFFEWDQSHLRCRPMKGTQRRGHFVGEDRALATSLLSSHKKQAENIMIVDLIRNDMAKVAQLGSVKVQSLLELEPYPNVWQLVSEITCETEPGVGFTNVVAALFPSGSVTGAPKPSAMSLIALIEETSRGVYCGTVGLLEPVDDGVHATFNVAIRTAGITAEGGEFGSGGGIVTNSEPSREFGEMLLKAQQLQSPPPYGYRLLETFRHIPEGPTDLRERHLARLRRSALRLGFRWSADLSDVVHRRLALVEYEARVRVLLSLDGRLAIQHSPAPERSDDPVYLVLDDETVASDDLTLFYKTTRRSLYNRRQRRFPCADDVIMVNERGECTEVTTANVAVRRGNTWLTPPLSSGCIPGIAREELLERGEISEGVVLAKDLATADDIAVFNSLRGWRRALLMSSPTQ
jgi:para-aminobenzoate synthetase/4-amino-4-deoxychorismate lyase